jgi:hypothetical protein
LLRLVLAQLLLGRCDQSEIVFGVLIVIFRSYRVACASRIASELHIFFGNMRGGAADLDIRSVRFKDPGHRVLAAAIVIIVVIIIVVIPTAHTLVVVVRTVSHVVPFTDSR